MKCTKDMLMWQDELFHGYVEIYKKKLNISWWFWFLTAICIGSITETGACRSERYINNTKRTVQSEGRCISPDVCECTLPSPKPNYFYSDGPYCKRKYLCNVIHYSLKVNKISKRTPINRSFSFRAWYRTL